MTQAAQTTPSAEATNVVEVRSPITGEIVGEVPIMSADEVREVVSRARVAQQAWRLLSCRERGKLVIRFRDALVDHATELVDILAREAGKPRQEGLLHEVGAVAEVATYFASHAGRILATHEAPLRLMKHRKSTITYRPRGVVGVISPWNFPLFLPFRDAIAAVMAGNAAVVKSSEITPLVVARAKEIWDRSGMPPDLLGVVTGRGETGAALIDAGIDMCVFTGSVSTGRRVAGACGERLIPCVMELGGKAPLIACADSDIERTAQAIVGGGFANSGQVCLSVERVYAHSNVHDPLLNRVVELVEKLRIGDPANEICDIGGITFAKQVDVAEAHIADALEKGGVVRCGGKRRDDAVCGFLPTVISNVDHDATVMREEIFGPIVPFMRVASDEEAVTLANQSHLGLNAYVFTEDSVRGRRLAGLLDAGAVLVNDVLVNGGMPETPFGGIKESGFGRVLGAEGLRAMCHTKHISVDRVKMPARNPLWFPYTKKSYATLQKGLRAMFTSGGLFKRLSEFF
jgi:succinate-semialdehyde dehydrogenase/glutarate-semialdehyde dehydrogenase